MSINELEPRMFSFNNPLAPVNGAPAWDLYAGGSGADPAQ